MAFLRLIGTKAAVSAFYLEKMKGKVTPFSPYVGVAQQRGSPS
jgi:hypothetical protein